MSGTPRLSMPFLSVGQAQKELFHNEALQVLDTVVAAAVIETPRNDPPASPVEGSCYIVATAPTGAWSGNGQNLATYTGGGWRFVAPLDGMAAYVISANLWATFCAGLWEMGAVRGSSLIL